MFIYKKCRCSLKLANKYVSLAQLREHSRLLRVISSPRRLQLLLILANGSHCVRDLIAHTGMSQTLVSHHLADLAKAGLLASSRHGTYANYRLMPKGKLMVRHLIDCLKKV